MKKFLSSAGIYGAHSHVAGLRTVAVFEGLKGVLVLLAGFALLRYVHQDFQNFAEDLVRHLHLNPAHRLPRIFLEGAGRVPAGQVQLLASGAFLYAVVRFVEAYGLWRSRAWGEWFALISCILYLPVELYELARGISSLKLVLFVINLVVVCYLWYALQDRPDDAKEQHQGASE